MMENIIGRLHGPMNFRLFLQPLMAISFGLRDARRDAREGKPAFFWALFTDPGHRRELVHSGWKSVSKVFVIALILDAVYQYRVLKWFYLGEALLVALTLAVVPYLALRGPLSRVFVRKQMP